MITKHEALDTLDRLEFFQGQRAGRELWFEKNSQLQDIDIACFVRDISNLREYIKTADVAPRAEVAREIFEEIRRYIINHCYLADDDVDAIWKHIDKLEKKYTEEK